MLNWRQRFVQKSLFDHCMYTIIFIFHMYVHIFFSCFSFPDHYFLNKTFTNTSCHPWKYPNLIEGTVCVQIRDKEGKELNFDEACTWWTHCLWLTYLLACQSVLQPCLSLGLLYNQSSPGVRFLNKIIFYRMGTYLLSPCLYSCQRALTFFMTCPFFNIYLLPVCLHLKLS
jgi:hypothetical protein